MKPKFAAITLCIALAAIALSAPDPVGTWTGRVVVDASKMDKTLDPNTRKQIEKQSLAASSAVIRLTLKSNKSYTASTTGGPRVAKPDVGAWKQSGNKIILTSTSKEMVGNPAATQTFLISAKGDMLTLNLPSYRGVTAKLVLKRAMKGK